MRFDEAFTALTRLTNYETMVRPPYGTREMNLPRTRVLIEALGRPDREYAKLQVAGTKGKGTTSYALARILEAAGLRTGLYLSPHLFSVRERIQVNGRWILKEEFAAGVAEILPRVEALRGTPECPTFFEMLTCLALLHFSRAGVDVAVLEVGLGGRLDATSAVRPVASIVTHVGLDHTAILGKTRTRIAAEKAGVAKRGVLLVSGVTSSSAAGGVISTIAERKGAPLLVSGRDFRIRTFCPEWRSGKAATAATLRDSTGEPRRLRPSVLGRDLARDAALATATLLVPRIRKRFGITDEAIGTGLAALSPPGRIQVVAENPFIVVDGAHNPDSARSLAATLRETLPFRRVFAVLGGGVDKDVPGTARHVASLGPLGGIFFTRPASHPRAADPEELAATFPGAVSCPNLQSALDLARDAASPEDLVVVTGSLYLAGEALGILGLTPSGT